MEESVTSENNLRRHLTASIALVLAATGLIGLGSAGATTDPVSQTAMVSPLASDRVSSNFAIGEATASSTVAGQATVLGTASGGGALPVSVSISSPFVVSTNPTGSVTYGVTVIALSRPDSLAALSPKIRSPHIDQGSLCTEDTNGWYAEVCATMYFNARNYAGGGSTYFYLDAESYGTKAVNLDPHDVSLTNIAVEGAAMGHTCSGGYQSSIANNWNHSNPTSGSTYTNYPSWAGVYVLNYSGLANYQSLAATLTWYYHGSPNYLYVSYTPPNDGGWPHTNDCVVP